MLSKAKLEKNWVHQLMKEQFTIKYLIFGKFRKFPVLYLNSLFSISGKIDHQIPCFPCAVATLLWILVQGVLLYMFLKSTHLSFVVMYRGLAKSLPIFNLEPN